MSKAKKRERFIRGLIADPLKPAKGFEKGYEKHQKQMGLTADGLKRKAQRDYYRGRKKA